MKRKKDLIQVLKNIGGKPVNGTYEEGVKDVVWWILEEIDNSDFRYSINRNKTGDVDDNCKDGCTWDNEDCTSSQYYNEYKKQKAQGKNIRIPTLDGDVDEK
jgi:hypothetical protein